MWSFASFGVGGVESSGSLAKPPPPPRPPGCRIALDDAGGFGLFVFGVHRWDLGLGYSLYIH